MYIGLKTTLLGNSDKMMSSLN